MPVCCDRLPGGYSLVPPFERGEPQRSVCTYISEVARRVGWQGASEQSG